MKTCNRCATEKPYADFCKAAASPDGYAWECRVCNRARHTARIEADPTYVRRRHLRVRYGLSLEAYDSLLAEQGGRCAICGTAPEGVLYVDHDHECCPGIKTCGECIRGLLCDACNRGLGYFRDNHERLQSAINYLKEF